VTGREIWPRVPIRELYEGLYDGPHATPPPASDGPVFLGIGNITAEGHLDLTNIRHIDEGQFPRWTRRVEPRAADIVFTYEATLNRYAMIPEGFRGCLGRRLALIRPDPIKVDPQFLFYSFFAPDWRATIAENTLSGSTVDRIPLTRFPTFEVSLPPPPVQRRIVGVLAAYDRLIDINVRRATLLEEMARSLYHQWLMERRPPAPSQIGEAAETRGARSAHWTSGALRDVVRLEYGRALPASARRAGQFPVFGSSGVVGLNAEALIKGPGVIVGRKGNVGTVYWSPTDFYPIDTVFWARSSLPSEYVYHLLKSIEFVSGDTAVPGLSRDYAHSVPVFIPDSDAVHQFVRVVGPMMRLSHLLGQTSAALAKTRDLVLPLLMTGAIEVGDPTLMEPIRRQ